MGTQIVKLPKRNTCRICNGRITTFLNLGMTPLADRFPVSDEQEEKYYPLELGVCKSCYLVQLRHDAPDNELFSEDYAFYSSGSPSSVEYFRKYAEDLYDEFTIEADRFTFEIASNDGILIKFLRDLHNCRILGIDPAQNVAAEANNQGIPTIANFFNKKNALTISRDEGRASLIVANNVVAHVVDLHDFMDGVATMLDINGVFVFEVQYFPNLFFNNQFDHVYHEHRSFFSLSPLITLLKLHGLHIFDVREQNTQGGSIRVFASLKKRPVHSRVTEMLVNEKKIGLQDIKLYKSFQYRAEYIQSKLRIMLDQLKKQGKIIAGYGASAKGNTLLNYCGITPNDLEFIADKTPYKYGRFTPGTHIRVVDQDAVIAPDYYLLLVWNYAESILQREQGYRLQGGKFIMPLPVPHII